ncbi:hypothetical protein [Embleya sp. NPDC059237]|uniref:hypothetical protein n=1 Tax=Embleya sp. NPDC059237 TaxID=3346784 RepID=UPI0036741CCF
MSVIDGTAALSHADAIDFPDTRALRKLPYDDLGSLLIDVRTDVLSRRGLSELSDHTHELENRLVLLRAIVGALSISGRL